MHQLLVRGTRVDMAIPYLSFLFRSTEHGDSRDRRRGGHRRVIVGHAAMPDGDTRAPSADASPLEVTATARHARDTVWVHRLRLGDADAFTAMFRAYYVILVRFLRPYFENLSDAEDVAQDTMANIWERRTALDPERSLQSLIFTTGRNRALDIRRRGRRMITHADNVQTQYANGENLPVERPADEQLLADELSQMAARYIAQLPPRQRDIFQLSRHDGLSPAEIGSVLGIATQTVYVQLSRITKTLYDALHTWTRGE